MKKQELKDILNSLRISKELEKYSLVYLMDLPREKELLGLNRSIDRNDIYIYIYNESPKPLMIGDEFDILVPCTNPLNYIEMPILMKYFSMNRKIEIDKLYAGYSAIGLLEFINGIPSIIYKMKEYMSKDFDDTETFFLMSRDLYMNVLEIYRKKSKKK